MKQFKSEPNSHRICLAPMLDYTDRHFRYLLRLLSKKTFLYSEMVTCGAILFGNRDHHLSFSNEEHPLSLQLGGGEPSELGKACKIASEYGYDEINLNVGCPSPRVQSGKFGAMLMEHPKMVAQCMQQMQQNSDLPISIKTRIGIDQQQDGQQLYRLLDNIEEIGIKLIIVHARTAWLDGLSPKENRDIPPLQYDLVYQLKKQRPHLKIILNGGIKSIEQMEQHLRYVDGVMIGREAYQNSFLFSQIDEIFYAEKPTNIKREQVLLQYCDYIEEQMSLGTPFSHMAKHTLGLVYGCNGARKYRRYLSENIHLKGANPECLLKAFNLISI